MISRIEIEGVDKTGKDLLAGYIDRLSNRRYVVNARGLLSMMVYSDIYNRNYDYQKELEDNKNTLVVYLKADIEDLQIRHKLSNEPKIDIERDMKVFDDYVEVFLEKGIRVLTFDTSKETPYSIAKAVLEYIAIGGNDNESAN